MWTVSQRVTLACQWLAAWPALPMAVMGSGLFAQGIGKHHPHPTVNTIRTRQTVLAARVRPQAVDMMYILSFGRK